MPQALEETSRVRVEFGYPIMVTPLSQFVGSQAAINVIVGERYKEVTDQVIRYALGHFGEEAVTAMDQERARRILDRPRAQARSWRRPAPIPPSPTCGAISMRQGVSDEELLLRWLLTKEDIAAMRAAGPAKPYVTTRHPLVRLMAELTRQYRLQSDPGQQTGFALTLERKGG